MNTTKSGSYGKLIAFFLVAVILLCAFGFAVEGWQPDSQIGPDSGAANNQNSGNADNGTNNNDTPVNGTPEAPPPPKIPDFLNVLTGLETTEALSKIRHNCFVISSDAPLYGLASADIVAELPTEDGSTRYLVFTNQTKNLGKIGSIAPTRGYMSNIAKNFGAVLISLGNDDSGSYTQCDITASYFDLKANTGHHYTEFTHFSYTNGDLITAGLANSGITTSATEKASLPYIFNDYFAEPILGETSAKSVIIPFSSSAETELYYSITDKKYSLSKNGTQKEDMLCGEALSFDNVFVLFADSVTYEEETGSEMVMNTIGKGKGYYITNGTAREISWNADPLGNMTFYDTEGNQLKVNRGTSYLSFVKSSKTAEVKIS